MRTMIHGRIFLGAVALCFASLASADPIVSTIDSIDAADRTNLVTFEGLPNNVNNPQQTTEDGVVVTQVNGDSNGIWTNCTGCWASNGTQSWYANGGDHGYTEINLLGGGQIGNLGVDLGHGWTSTTAVTVLYELLSNGLTVLQGNYAFQRDSYISFLGGGFDTVRLAGYFGNVNVESFGGYQALALDNIEISAVSISVPEPATLALFGAGLLGLGFRRRRIA